jgi:hypothetical protein
MNQELAGRIQSRLDSAIVSLAHGCEDADDVAERLSIRNIKGRRECPKKCPVALYLLAELADVLPSRAVVDVSGMEVVILLPESDDDVTRLAYAEFPDAIDEFIRGFDDSEYPDLIGV